MPPLNDTPKKQCRTHKRAALFFLKAGSDRLETGEVVVFVERGLIHRAVGRQSGIGLHVLEQALRHIELTHVQSILGPHHLQGLAQIGAGPDAELQAQLIVVQHGRNPHIFHGDGGNAVGIGLLEGTLLQNPAGGGVGVADTVEVGTRLGTPIR